MKGGAYICVCGVCMYVYVCVYGRVSVPWGDHVPHEILKEKKKSCTENNEASETPWLIYFTEDLPFTF